MHSYTEEPKKLPPENARTPLNLRSQFISQHTVGHIDCVACERSRTSMFSLAADQKFEEAAATWLEIRSFPASHRSRFVSPRSLLDLQQYIDSLDRFLHGMRLSSIHIGTIREYQKLRAFGNLGPPDAKKKREVGPNKINQEVGTLIRILKQARCWTPELEGLYLPLQREEYDIPRALSPAEQEIFLAVAGSRTEWGFVYWYSILGLHAPLSTNEARALHIGDLDLHNNLIMVRVASSKNRYRTRSIPLSDQSRWAVDRMLERAKGAGATGPQHYLMPFRKQHIWKPELPMTVSGIKRQWNEVRKAADVSWLRPYDLRHCCITRLAEAGTPIPVIMSLAGHVSRRMMEHYTHISEQAKRKAVQSVYPQLSVVHRMKAASS